MSSALREAAQQALEAMQSVDHATWAWACVEAIASLRAALAEPDVPETDFGNMAVAVAEPVASVTECEACFTPDVCQLRGTCDHYAAERLRVAAPPQRKPLAEPVQGPVAWQAVGGSIWAHKTREDDRPLYTAPQPAPALVPLTEAQIWEIGNTTLGQQGGWNVTFARAIEAAHGITADAPSGRDWSLLEATQESLREHMAEIQRLRAAVAAERERCAVLVEDTQRQWPGDGLNGHLLAAEIRAAA